MTNNTIKHNVFVIDSVTEKIVARFNHLYPKKKANEIASGYFEKGEGRPKHKPIPTKKYPNRFGIQTPTDFFIHYFI